MAKPFERLGSEPLLQTRIFKVRQDRAKHPERPEPQNYFVIEMADVVNMVAETTDGQLILVRQWRHGVRSMELELPAGLIDEGEDPLTAAKRELVEETGAVAERWERLGEVLPSPAILSNRCTTFWASGCVIGHPQNQDADEDIEVVTHTAKEVRALLASGQIRSSQTVAALYRWLDRRGQVHW